jgi:endonuclease YncB( thermonuclease family)
MMVRRVRIGRRTGRPAFAALAIALSIVACAAHAFAGKVIGVSDGDTLTVLDRQQPVRVRLAGIDAPETGQPFARRAKTSLSELAFGKVALVDAHGRDVYGRVLGRVRVGSVDLSAEQVRRGYAWVFRRFTRDPELIALEDDARAARRGLWADRAPIPPWTWRDRHPSARREST